MSTFYSTFSFVVKMGMTKEEWMAERASRHAAGKALVVDFLVLYPSAKKIEVINFALMNGYNEWNSSIEF
jgi:hypothetical protein